MEHVLRLAIKTELSLCHSPLVQDDRCMEYCVEIMHIKLEVTISKSTNNHYKKTIEGKM